MSLLDDNAQPLDNIIRADAYRARNLGINAVDEDPERGAQALRLAKLTNVPAPAIHADFDEFTAAEKRKSVTDLVGGSPALQDYINSHPLAATVSNDDLAHLDTAGDTLRRFRENKLLNLPSNMLGAFGSGFVEGFGPQAMGSWVKDEKGLSADPTMPGWAAWSTLGLAPEAILRVLSGGIKGATEAAVEGVRSAGPTLGLDALSQATGGAIGNTESLARDVGGLVEQLTTEPGHAAHVAAKPDLFRQSQVKVALDRAAPYLERGEEPPTGLHPIIDELKAEQAKIDAEALRQMEREAQQSTTRERAPDFYANFARQQTDIELGLGAEAVRKLYGEKPLDGEGPLSYIHNLKEQVELSETYGGDVIVPVPDWLAHTAPEVMKELRDNIRVGRRGMTLEEAKATEQPHFEQPALDAFEQDVGAVRQMMQVGPLERKLALQRKLPDKDPKTMAADNGLVWGDMTTYEQQSYIDAAGGSKFGPEQGFHDFEMLDQDGKKVGYVNLSEQAGGKGVHVDMISGAKGYGPADFGPRLMRDLLRQIADAFPEAEYVEGFRVSGAREKADKMANVRIPLRRLDTPVAQLEQFFKGWEEVDAGLEVPPRPDTTGYRDVGLGTKVKDVDEAALTPKQWEIINRVDELLGRIAPNRVTAEPVERIAHRSGSQPLGLYTMYKEAEPVIRWAVDGRDTAGTARHEAIHHLRNYGFFTREEWGALERSAREGGWVEKHGISSKGYVDKNGLFLEEAIANEYTAWANDPARYKGPAATIFEKIKHLLEYIKQNIEALLGKDLKADDIFAAVEEGFIGSRQGTKPLREDVFQQAEDRPQDRPPFATASAFGSTERNAKRYASLVAKRNAEDFAKALKRAEAQASREQTPEWKANYTAMKEETTAQIDARPDVVALNALNNRVWLGEKLDHALRLDSDLIPLDLRERVPKDWVEKDAASPDVTAQMLGYPDGRSMIEAILAVEDARKAEGLSYAKWRERQIKTTTDARMAAAYGDLKENIADAARDQALSETQMDLLHEETLALALDAGATFSITKDQMRNMVRDHFEAQPARGLKPEQFMTAAGRAGRKVEDALLAGKPLEAFKAKQQQFIATLMSKEAAGWAKEQKKLDTLIKRLSPHHVESMETGYANYAQDLLQKAGVPIRRSATDIALGLAHEGRGSFGEFLATNFREGGELYATPELQAGVHKPYEDMTVGERRDFDRTLRTLWTEGRATQKLIVAGERYDLAEVRKEINDNIRSLPLQKGPSPVRDWVYGFDAMTAKPEEMLKDLDLRQDMGPLFKYVMVPMADAKAHKYTMLEELSDSLKKISDGFKGDWRKTLEDTIPQDFLVDPADGQAFDMKRENLIQIMLNWGTESNRKKFADGWGRGTSTVKLTKEQSRAFEAKVKDLIDRHATAADWDYVQKVWGVFENWKPLTDTVYRNLSGTAPKWIPNSPFETPHGPIEGKYFPIIYDSYYGNIDAKRSVAPSVGQFPADYYRSTTANGHTIERTGYTDNVQFMRPLETVAARMQQTIHDIAFREAVINTNKILFDPAISSAITRHYGKPYKDNLQAWVGRVANETNLNERELAAGYAVLRQFRLNLIGHALPFNFNVLLSPDLGTANPKAITNFLANRSENMKFVMENSKEIQHMVYSMDRDFREALTATIGKEDQLSAVRKFMIEKGFSWITKLSQQLRAATWLHEYNAQRAKGFTNYEASQLADSTVRERHGGASVVDLPSIMASNEAMKTFTMFYGYFNTMQNWMRQIPGNVRRGEWEKAASALWGTVGIGAIMNAGLFNKQAENDSWFKIISKAVGLQIVQGIPMARDAASYWVEGYTPRAAFASASVAVKSLVNDAVNAYQKKPVKKPVQHTLNAIGVTTGLPMAQFGRTGEFLYDVATKQQHPRNIIEWMRGLRTGEARLPKK